jgi:predicted DNA-binding ribbon-helix-helix protein
VARAVRYDSALETYSVKLGKRWTTIRLEPDLMTAFREIASALACRPDDLISEIALARGSGSLTSALRLFIVNYYRQCARSPVSVGAVNRTSLASDVVRASLETTDLRPGDRRANPGLKELLDAWSLSQSNALDPDIVEKCGLLGFVHTVDVSVADPMNYWFRVWAASVRLSASRPLLGSRLGDFPSRAYREAVGRDYFTAATTGTWRLQLVRASVTDAIRAYQRLSLPILGASGHVERLVVAVRYEAT